MAKNVEVRREAKRRAEELGNKEKVNQECYAPVDAPTMEQQIAEADELRKAIADREVDKEATSKRENIVVLAEQGKAKAESDDRLEAEAKAKAKSELEVKPTETKTDESTMSSVELMKKVTELGANIAKKDNDYKAAREKSMAEFARLKAEAEKAKEREAQEIQKAEEARRAEEVRKAKRDSIAVVYRCYDREIGKNVYYDDSAAANQATPGEWVKVYVFKEKDSVRELTRAEMREYLSINPV